MKSPLRHLSLFSGIGGFDLAAERCGWVNVAHVEKDAFCRKILQKHFPNAKSYDNIKTFDPATENIGTIDLISGGFPCQPFSQAGQLRGSADDRYLWPEMLRIIETVRPTWVVAENVLNLLNMAQHIGHSYLEDAAIGSTTEDYLFEGICKSLEQAGYTVQAIVIPAASLNAFHLRRRLWIIAHLDRHPNQQSQKNPKAKSLGLADAVEAFRREWETILHTRHSHVSRPPASTLQQYLKGCAVEPCFRRDADGVSHRLDAIRRRNRALGNAIVPQIATVLFSFIDFITTQLSK